MQYIDLVYREKPEDLVFIAQDARGSSQNLGRPSVLDGNIARYWVKSSVIGFTLEGKKPFFKKHILTKVAIRGVPLASIEARAAVFDKAISSIDIKKSEVEKLLAKVIASIEDLKNLEGNKASIEEDIEEKQGLLDELQEEIEKLDKQRSEHKELNQAEQIKHQSLVSDSNRLKNSVSQLEVQQGNLNSSIVQSKETLAKLTSDKNLFTEEVATFNRQSNAQKRVYSIFALLPLLLIAILGIGLLTEAQEIATSKLSWDEALALLTSHMPRAVTTIFIIWASYSISRAFIQRVMDLDRQQLSFSKLGIVAREVSKSSSEGLDLSPEEEYERRVLLKMSLLKTYLKEELGKQFDYQKIFEERMAEASWTESLVARLFSAKKNIKRSDETNEKDE